jgi:AmpD protein
MPYTDAQYEALVPVTRALMREFRGISLGRIVGHSDVAPGRKTDPGAAFDWNRYRRALR